MPLKTYQAQALYPNQDKAPFDPLGDEYDYISAEAAGMKPKSTGTDSGHWGSVVATTVAQQKKHKLPANSYMMLKGRNHETWDLAVQAEEARGFIVKWVDDRYFSVPADTAGKK